jgi:hypothetical protein
MLVAGLRGVDRERHWGFSVNRFIAFVANIAHRARRLNP